MATNEAPQEPLAPPTAAVAVVQPAVLKLQSFQDEELGIRDALDANAPVTMDQMLDFVERLLEFGRELTSEREWRLAHCVANRTELLSRWGADARRRGTDEDWLALANATTQGSSKRAAEKRRSTIHCEALQLTALCCKQLDLFGDGRLAMLEAMHEAGAVTPQMLLNTLSIVSAMGAEWCDEALDIASQAVDILSADLGDLLQGHYVSAVINGTKSQRMAYENKRFKVALMLVTAQAHQLASVAALLAQSTSSAQSPLAQRTAHPVVRLYWTHRLVLDLHECQRLYIQELAEEVDDPMAVDLGETVAEQIQGVSEWVCGGSSVEASMELSVRWKYQVRRARQFAAMHPVLRGRSHPALTKLYDANPYAAAPMLLLAAAAAGQQKRRRDRNDAHIAEAAVAAAVPAPEAASNAAPTAGNRQEPPVDSAAAPMPAALQAYLRTSSAPQAAASTSPLQQAGQNDSMQVARADEFTSQPRLSPGRHRHVHDGPKLPSLSGRDAAGAAPSDPPSPALSEAAFSRLAAYKVGPGAQPAAAQPFTTPGDRSRDGSVATSATTASRLTAAAARMLDFHHAAAVHSTGTAAAVSPPRRSVSPRPFPRLTGQDDAVSPPPVLRPLSGPGPRGPAERPVAPRPQPESDQQPRESGTRPRTAAEPTPLQQPISSVAKERIPRAAPRPVAYLHETSDAQSAWSQSGAGRAAAPSAGPHKPPRIPTHRPPGARQPPLVVASTMAGRSPSSGSPSQQQGSGATPPPPKKDDEADGTQAQRPPTPPSPPTPPPGQASVVVSDDDGAEGATHAWNPAQPPPPASAAEQPVQQEGDDAATKPEEEEQAPSSPTPSPEPVRPSATGRQ